MRTVELCPSPRGLAQHMPHTWGSRLPLLFIVCPLVIPGAAFQEELLVPSPFLANRAHSSRGSWEAGTGPGRSGPRKERGSCLHLTTVTSFDEK